MPSARLGIQQRAARVNALFSAAVQHHEAGRLNTARELYQLILQQEPEHSKSLLLLGKSARQLGRVDEALVMIQRAVDLNPQDTEFLLELGGTLIELSRFEEAIDVLEHAVELNSACPRLHYALGLASMEGNQLERAIIEMMASLNLDPLNCEAYAGLGRALLRKGDRKAAYASLRGALMLGPGNLATLYRLAADFRMLGAMEYAARCFKLAIHLAPKDPGAYSHLANVLNQTGRFQEAVIVAEEGLSLDATSPSLQYELGNGQMQIGHLEAAIGSYKRALALTPDANIASNCAFCLMEQGWTEEAKAYFELALKIDPKHVVSFSNLIYFHAFSQVIPPQEQLKIARAWECAALSEEDRAAARLREFKVKPLEGRKLRVGVLSAEFGRHAVAEFLLPILEHLNRERFEIFLYPTKIYNDERAKTFFELADAWKPVIGVDDAAAAEMIRSDGIDVLLETTGHTNGGRLGIVAHRAAPVQCTAIGFWASTGVSEMDWYITDESAPPEFDAHFSERLWRLHRTAGCYRGNSSLPETEWMPASDGTIRIGSFNKYGKVREATLALWSKVLRAIPETKLVLEDRNAFDSTSHRRIMTILERHGVGPERVIFLPAPKTWTAHMLNYDMLDIAVDTIPFNSGTTAYDALWMGVPLVAMEGTWTGGIMAAAVLRTLGHPEWVANSEEEYVSIITALARDVDSRSRLRKTQRARMAASPLYGATAMAGNIADAFVAMYNAWAISGGIQAHGTE